MNCRKHDEVCVCAFEQSAGVGVGVGAYFQKSTSENGALAVKVSLFQVRDNDANPSGSAELD